MQTQDRKTPCGYSAQGPATHFLTLLGAQVTKKNKPRPRKGGLYYDKQTHAAIDNYLWQAKAAWRNQSGPLPPLNRFAYYMELWNQRGDPDGIVTTTLDCLKRAGVIADDAAKHCVRWGGEARTDDHGPRVKVTLERLDDVL